MALADNVSVTQVSWHDAANDLNAVRSAVFVREQGVSPDLEWDGLDDRALHVMARTPDGTPVGTGRLLLDGHIGRMAVLASCRGSGIGTRLLTALINLARDRDLTRVYLHAQTHALGFYERWEFIAEGAEFDEAGIPHRLMTLQLSNAENYSPE